MIEDIKILILSYLNFHKEKNAVKYLKTNEKLIRKVLRQQKPHLGKISKTLNAEENLDLLVYDEWLFMVRKQIRDAGKFEDYSKISLLHYGGETPFERKTNGEINHGYFHDIFLFLEDCLKKYFFKPFIEGISPKTLNIFVERGGLVIQFNEDDSFEINGGKLSVYYAKSKSIKVGYTPNLYYGYLGSFEFYYKGKYDKNDYIIDLCEFSKKCGFDWNTIESPSFV